MSDYDYNEYNEDKGYDSDNLIIPDDEVNDDNDGFNLDNQYYEAKNDKDIEKFEQIIAIESDNNTNLKEHSFKSYCQLAIIYLERKDKDNFLKNFSEYISLYSKMHQNDQTDTMNELFQVISLDNDFHYDICLSMIDKMNELRNKDKSIEKELLTIGTRFCNTLLSLGKITQFKEILGEMNYLLDVITISDIDIRSLKAKLEIIVFSIIQCNLDGDFKGASKLYYSAEALTKNEKIIPDKKLTSVINEQAGRILMSKKNYYSALEKFKISLYDYQESGNQERAKLMLKYSIINSIIVRNSLSIVSHEEIKMYKDDTRIINLMKLKDAYDSANIKLINEIWNVLKTEEKDEFILNQLNDILYEIRFNYIKMKMNYYKKLTFKSVQNDLGVDKEYVLYMLMDIASSDESIKINFTNEYLEYFEENSSNSMLYSTMNQWITNLN